MAAAQAIWVSAGLPEKITAKAVSALLAVCKYACQELMDLYIMRTDTKEAFLYYHLPISTF